MYPQISFHSYLSTCLSSDYEKCQELGVCLLATNEWVRKFGKNFKYFCVTLFRIWSVLSALKESFDEKTCETNPVSENSSFIFSHVIPE